MPQDELILGMLSQEACYLTGNPIQDIFAQGMRIVFVGD
jgi:hypothetical protein